MKIVTKRNPHPQIKENNNVRKMYILTGNNRISFKIQKLFNQRWRLTMKLASENYFEQI